MEASAVDSLLAEAKSVRTRWGLRLLFVSLATLSFASTSYLLWPARAATPAKFVALATSPGVVRADALEPGGELDESEAVHLLGSSQLRTVAASSARGVMVDDQTGTTVDAVADALGRASGVRVVRSSYAAITPLEMLLVARERLRAFPRSRSFTIALMWEGLARDRILRQEFVRLVARADRDPFASELLSLGAPPEVMSELRNASLGEQSERVDPMKTAIATPLDASVTRGAASIYPILGNLNVQGEVLRHWQAFTQTVRRNGVTPHDVVPANLEFNRKSLVLLVRYLGHRGVRVHLYRTPRRSDVPPLTQLVGEDAFFDALSRELELPIADLRSAVPNKYWGFAGGAPDLAHFGISGHQVVGRALADIIRSSADLHP